MSGKVFVNSASMSSELRLLRALVMDLDDP